MQTKARRSGSPARRVHAHPPVGPQSDDPLYLQVIRVLKDEIVRGVYPVGSQLPPEEELRQRFSVSRHTIREALRRLREDNLISSRQGAATTVVSPRSSDSYVHEVTSISDLVAFATGVRFAIDTIELIEVDADLAARLGVKSGEPWLAVLGYRNMEG
ncbi:MAG: GntR family transcriptional regulator, partial [Proteobacteria bacterium]|nr:GntR family transcriptional regulator [Pseudomonadota bacterium]